MVHRKYDSEMDARQFWIEYGVDLEARTLMLDDDVDADIVGWLTRGIRKMEQDDPQTPITVIVNTYGGVCYDGYDLYDTMRTCSCPITTIASGKVMSMGTTILLAGDTRLSLPRTSFMCHSVAGGVDSESKIFELEVDVKETKKLYEMMLEIYVERCKYKDLNWWRKKLQYKDWFFDANKAVEIGLVHEIVEEVDK